MANLIEYTAPAWRNLNMRALGVDEAFVVLKSLYHKPAYLYALSDACYTCPYSRVRAFHQHNDTGIGIKQNVAYALKYRVMEEDVGPYVFENDTSLCEIDAPHLQEFGVYNFTVTSNGGCHFATDKEGVDVYLPLLSAFLVITMLLSLVKLSCYFWQRYSRIDAVDAVPSTEADKEQNPVLQRKRMRSLDGFRGMAIVLMIFVNSGGGHYEWMEHAPWNGLHVADIVFPCFLWIMGVCIPISVKSQLGRGHTKWQICRRIIVRAIKLFALGICLNSIWGPNLEKLRIMGVLQRFGVAYLVCGVAHTIFSKPELLTAQLATWKRFVYDLILLKGELLLALALTATSLGLLLGLKVPDCPTGYLGPGGKHNYAAHTQCTGGAAAYIDLQVLGPDHIYQHSSARFIYDAANFDPEGILGCLMTIVQVLLGLVAGVIILTYTPWRARILRWMLWAVVLGLLGGGLCAFSTETGPIPINKNLWSVSFVLVTTALAFLALGVLYFVIDVREWWSGWPFVPAGMNAILLYVGHMVFHSMLPWHWRIGEMNTHFVLLLEALWTVLLWILIALYLDAKKFYYSV